MVFDNTEKLDESAEKERGGRVELGKGKPLFVGSTNYACSSSSRVQLTAFNAKKSYEDWIILELFFPLILTQLLDSAVSHIITTV